MLLLAQWHFIFISLHPFSQFKLAFMKKHYTYLFLTITLFLSKTITIKAQVKMQDSLALVDLYNSTNGPSWKHHDNWLVGPVINWYGVYVAGDERVASISLSVNNLEGFIPSSLGNLSNLNFLGLTNNKLSGYIPSSLGNLSNLKYLFLSDNKLSGYIPLELGNLSNLIELRLFNNQLNGAIPPALGNLSKLEYLYLKNNQLSEFIPAQLGNLLNLSALD
jgi:Leucine-rich repeat (LRR) protein